MSAAGCVLESSPPADQIDRFASIMPTLGGDAGIVSAMYALAE